MASLFSAMFLAQITGSASAASAMSSTKSMYAFWCVSERTETPLCKQHSLQAQLTPSMSSEERANVLAKIKEVSASARAASKTSASPFSKDFAAMKLAYCATNPPGAKTLCSSAASRFGGSSPSTEAMDWYCSKRLVEGGQADGFCK